MTKMISHRVMHKQFDEHPAIKKLNEALGKSILDGPDSFVDIECDAFYIIPLSFEAHPVIKMLTGTIEFDLRDDNNLIYLPIIPAQAYMLGKARYTSDPIDSYVSIIKESLDMLGREDIIEICEAGDKVVIQRVLDNIRKIQGNLKSGLELQQVHATYPYTNADYQRDQAASSKLSRH